MQRAGGTSRLRTHGFTLLEVIVVIVIIGLLAAAFAPRFTGATKGRFDLAVDQVADLMTAFAHREALHQAAVGIRFNTRREALELVSRKMVEGAPEWVIDPSIRPVEFPREVDPDRLRVLVDGSEVDIKDYPFSHTPGEDRPMLEIILLSLDQEFETSLLLQPNDIGPKRVNLRGGSGTDDRELISARRPVDLDAEGRSREDW